MVTTFLHALWILTALGATILTAASTDRHPQRDGKFLVSAALGFAAALVLNSPANPPDLAAVAGLTSIIAAFRLFRPRYRLASAFTGGVLAGVAGICLQILGFSAVLATPLAIALPTAALVLQSRDSKFAPITMQEEALMALAVLSGVLAVTPGILSGWQSALALNRELSMASPMTIPAWALVFGATSLLLGGVYSLWRRP